ncbi:MAG: rhodanese-like domain-containing protein [Chloroflexota bacterium]|nr:rhodanese-like domain-containing protein [Chloroflexota bacterium]
MSDAPKPIVQISPAQLKARLDAGEDLFILDVRNPDEFEICTLSGAVELPLPQLQHAAQQIAFAGAKAEDTPLGVVPKDKTVVVHCHHGTRSAYAIMMLREIGFDADRLLNLDGGIDAWAAEVEPTMARY